LYSFTGKEDGGNPYGGVVRDADGNLYGTTINGGLPGATCMFRAIPGCGTVFMLSKEGKFTVLYSFTGGADGASSQATLVMDSLGRLYGTTVFGGAFGAGTVFMVDGERETVLYSFTGGTDGAEPFAGVVRDGAGNLYGTTLQGGSAENPAGTVFEVTPSGLETVLHSFNEDEEAGQFPLYGGLGLDAAGNLYGAAGAVGFRVHP
jgi:uncharacterized repeat protein (TIGR03803 family)